MARNLKHRVARCKLARREKEDLDLLSGVRSLDTKCKHDRAPGVHGQNLDVSPFTANSFVRNSV